VVYFGPFATRRVRPRLCAVVALFLLGDALQAFLTQGTERLPVVNSAADRQLLGVVSKSDLLLEIQSFTG